MYCGTCGTALADWNRFCSTCGTPVQLLTDGSKATDVAMREKEEMEERIAQATFEATLAEGETEYLQSRNRLYSLYGVIVMAVLLPGAISPVLNPSHEPDLGLFGIVLYVGILGLYFFSLPFGLIPIKNFIDGHSIVIIGNLFTTIFIVFIAVMFVTFAALPYMLIFKRKVKKAKKRTKLLWARVKSLQVDAQYV